MGGSKEVRPLRQLEAQMRSLEFENVATFFIKVESPLIKACEKTSKAYAAMTKEQGAQHQLGPPHLHTFATLLSELQNFVSGGSSPDIQMYTNIPSRLIAMMEKGQEEADQWVKVCGVSPTYERKLSRLSLDVQGQIVLGSGGHGRGR